MKIRDTVNSLAGGVFSVPARDDKKVAESRDASFHNHLSRFEDDSYEQKLRELVGKISEQGEKLSKRIDIGELRIYKKMVSEFLDEAMNHSFKFSKQSFLDRRGRHRVYAVIKKINEELDKLTADVLNEEKDNLKILQRVDDIRGLILDMIM